MNNAFMPTILRTPDLSRRRPPTRLIQLSENAQSKVLPFSSLRTQSMVPPLPSLSYLRTLCFGAVESFIMDASEEQKSKLFDAIQRVSCLLACVLLACQSCNHFLLIIYAYQVDPNAFKETKESYFKRDYDAGIDLYDWIVKNSLFRDKSTEGIRALNIADPERFAPEQIARARAQCYTSPDIPDKPRCYCVLAQGDSFCLAVGYSAQGPNGTTVTLFACRKMYANMTNKNVGCTFKSVNGQIIPPSSLPTAIIAESTALTEDNVSPMRGLGAQRIYLKGEVIASWDFQDLPTITEEEMRQINDDRYVLFDDLRYV